MAQTTKRLRRDPLAAYEWNVSPMAISPATVTPPRALSFGRPVHPFLGACTPQRGTCANAAALGVQWGTCSSIGPRAHMEDFGVVSAGDADVIFGVYDGHGGAFAAEYCQQQLHMAIRSHSAFPWDVPTAIKDGYLQTDREVVEALLRAESGGGACAIIAVVTQSNIIVGNCGDCRAVYSCGDEVHELSQDHTPENESEASRARAAGALIHLGFVALPDDGGELPVTRALGDVRMKAIDPKDRCDPDMQVVTSMPEICVVSRSRASAAFLILATDGLWSCCTSAQAATFVDEKLREHDNPQWAAEQLLQHVLMDMNTSDNVYITVVLVKPVAGPSIGVASLTPGPPAVRPGRARNAFDAGMPTAGSFTPPTNSPCVGGGRAAPRAHGGEPQPPANDTAAASPAADVLLPERHGGG